MALAERVLDTIRRLALHAPGRSCARRALGWPGFGRADAALGELEGAGELSIAGIAHLNHGLREAAGERRSSSAARWPPSSALPFRSDLVDVRALAARLGTSLEDAGRRARYELFERVATELGADVIATGHTRDDQAETFLLRLLRGAGPRGLGGIHPKTRLPAEAPKARTAGPARRSAEGAKVGRPASARDRPRRAPRVSGAGRSGVSRRREQSRSEHSAEPRPS